VNQLKCEVCKDTHSVDCEYCEDGTCSYRVDVDSYYPFKCNCDEGKRPCPECCAEDDPGEPRVPWEAEKIRKRIFSGPWA
jgi:hypothetical protein